MIIIKKIKILSAITLALSLSQVAVADTTLKIGAWLPPTHVQNDIVWPTWANWVEEATQGRVKIKMEYGLGNPKTMFDLVEDGAIDASFGYHGSVPGRFKLTQAIELPLLGTNAEAASVAHWRVFNKYFAKSDEHEGLEVLTLFTHGPGQMHLAQPINSLGDLKSKKVRLGGGVQSEVGKRMGVTAVGAPAPKVYEIMQQGVVDGIFMPTGEQKTLRLNEVTKNLVVLPGGMYLGSFAMFISPDFMDRISKEDRAAIRAVSGEKLAVLAGAAWDKADELGLQAAKDVDVDVTIVKPGDTMANEFIELAKGMDEEWFELVKEFDVDAPAALAEIREIARNYKPAQ
ncbi:TRAP transporter substrate-binding protein [Marinomonas sp. 2405UD68-3]|uniref:TRAP transporter substrate-binding protein n=1 Tax=Marinomonas sp. 2405UD68-3 TaxID=3391835 RepID=UPI0039C9938D